MNNRDHELYNSIRKTIQEYIEEKFLENNPVELTYEYHLLENGIIDSLSMMNLILFIEDKYKLDFYKIEANRDSFQNINTIADLISNNMKEEIKM
ncbi:MAG: acyl carrier protein [Clostridia bacterium]|nr:acyl carrier protein [Clostridia bacterium]